MHCLNVPGLCFHIWPDDGSFEPKHVTEFLISITIHCCATDWNEVLYYCNTQRGGSCQKNFTLLAEYPLQNSCHKIMLKVPITFESHKTPTTLTTYSVSTQTHSTAAHNIDDTPADKTKRTHISTAVPFSSKNKSTASTASRVILYLISSPDGQRYLTSGSD